MHKNMLNILEISITLPKEGCFGLNSPLPTESLGPNFPRLAWQQSSHLHILHIFQT